MIALKVSMLFILTSLLKINKNKSNNKLYSLIPETFSPQGLQKPCRHRNSDGGLQNQVREVIFGRTCFQNGCIFLVLYLIVK